MMFRQLVIFLLFGLVVPYAFSQEEVPKPPNQLVASDIFFQPGGGLRVRYENLRNATGQGFPEDEDESQASHRANFDIKLYKGEYIETFFRFINFADWGASTLDSSGGQKDGFSRSNGLLVNQAWGLWKVDDSLGIKFGRAPLHFGLGYTYGQNDWFNVPYSFDQLAVGWDWESLKLNLIAAKVQEFTKVANETLSSDPEENHIIINLDIKNLVDTVDTFTFNIVQVNRDLGSNDGGVSVLNGLNMQRLALEAEIKGRSFFGSLFFSYVTGEEKVAPMNRVGTIEKIDLAQTAFDLKLGYGFSEVNDLKFWAGYHYDSGDKQNSETESKTYDSFYYDVYGQSGLMDLIRWGNLTMFRLGLDVELVEGLTLGSEWLSMSRTEATDAVSFGEAGRFYNARITAGDLVLGNDKDIGNEFDIWMDLKFDSGVAVRTTFSNFFPGQVFSGATNNVNADAKPDSNFYQILTQVGYFF